MNTDDMAEMGLREDIFENDAEHTFILKEFEKETKPYRESLFNRAFVLTKNEHDAEDLIQITLMKAFRSWKSYQPGTNLPAWLMTIMLNQFINQHNKKEKEPDIWRFDGTNEGMLEVLLYQRDSLDSNDPADEILKDWINPIIMQAIHSLPKMHRIVVTLHDVGGLPYEEIAEALNIPLGTAKSRLFRGRRILRKQLLLLAKEYGLAKSKKKRFH